MVRCARLVLVLVWPKVGQCLHGLEIGMVSINTLSESSDRHGTISS